MYRIISKRNIVPNIHEMKVHHPDIARKYKVGQFIIVMCDEFSERIPLTIADCDVEEGSVTICFVEAGTSTVKLASKKEGDTIVTFVGPLGKPSEVSKFGKVLLVGGCYGIGGIYPVAKALKELDNKVIIAIEARSKNLLYWEDKLKQVSDAFYPVTRDGTYGYKGHVMQAIDIALKNEGNIDRVIAIGCTFMMMLASEHTKPLGIKTVVNLNPIMIDATGMCGVCRVQVGGKTQFACVDGPEFDAHEIDWNTLFLRRKAYLGEEATSLCMLEAQKDL